MGRRGPAPVPTYILAKRGSWRAKSRPREPRPRRGIDACPAWLHPNARVAWNALTGWMVDRGLLVRIDTPMLVRYCDAWARWVQAARFLNRHGESFPVRDRHGRVTGCSPYPQLEQYHRYDRVLAQLGRELGFDADTRLRAVMDPDGPFATEPPGIAHTRRLLGRDDRLTLPE